MNKLILSIAFALAAVWGTATLSAQPNAAALKHEVSASIDSAAQHKTKPTPKSAYRKNKEAQQAANNSSQPIVAYSDTTDNGDEDSTYNADYDNGNGSYDSDFDQDQDLKGLAEVLKGLGNASIIPIVALLLIFGGPLFIIALIIYLIFRNRREKYKMAQEALRQGKDLPPSMTPAAPRAYDGDLWAKGIKDTALGLGLTLLFLCIFGWGIMTGVGLLVTCIGIGKLVIVKTTPRKPQDDPTDTQDKTNIDPANDVHTDATNKPKDSEL